MELWCEYQGKDDEGILCTAYIDDNGRVLNCPYESAEKRENSAVKCSNYTPKKKEKVYYCYYWPYDNRHITVDETNRIYVHNLNQVTNEEDISMSIYVEATNVQEAKEKALKAFIQYWEEEIKKLKEKYGK